MNFKEDRIGVGRLWGNLQSLEASLRFILTQANPSENYITKSASLRTLVNKYNGLLSAAEQALYSVDPSIVDIRNAIAHGRVSGQYPGQPLPLTLSDYVIGESDLTMQCVT